MTHAHYTNTHHKDCENDNKKNAMCRRSAQTRECSAGKFRAAQNVVLQTKLQTNSATHQTHSRGDIVKTANKQCWKPSSQRCDIVSSRCVPQRSAADDCFLDCRSVGLMFLQIWLKLFLQNQVFFWLLTPTWESSSQQPQLHPQNFIRLRTTAHENVKDFLRASGLCIFHKLLAIFQGILLLQLQDLIFLLNIVDDIVTISITTADSSPMLRPSFGASQDTFSLVKLSRASELHDNTWATTLEQMIGLNCKTTMTATENFAYTGEWNHWQSENDTNTNLAKRSPATRETTPQKNNRKCEQCNTGIENPWKCET